MSCPLLSSVALFFPPFPSPSVLTTLFCSSPLPGVVNEPERRKQFKQFANTDENAAPIVERKIERNQPAIAEWPKDFPAVKLNKSDIHTPVAEWQWSKVASRSHLMPSSEGTTSVSVLVGDTQLAIWDVPGRGLYAAQQMCPHKRESLFDPLFLHLSSTRAVSHPLPPSFVFV